MNWLHKYKPTDFDQILGQNNVISMIQHNIKKLPHMIFYGPAGVSKTTVIDIVAQKIYGKDKKRNTLFLNASDERGINTVRNKIKNFAKQKIYSTNPKNTFDFKLIILDEADSMTSEAQTALRRIMESYSQITRFCFICNYVNKIINPISSRCAVFRFKKIHQDLIQQRLNFICEEEKCPELKSIIPTISNNTKGDIRQSIIILESLFKCIDKDHIANICRTNEIDILLHFHNFDQMKEYIDELFFDNSDYETLLLNIKSKIINSNTYDLSNKLDFLIKLNECQTKLNQNCNEKLLFYQLFSNFIS